MVTIEYTYHCSFSGDSWDSEPEILRLPITICDHHIRIMASDCCDTFVCPPLNDNDLAVLRRALTEWGHEEWLGLDERVEVMG
jgi:hypothetical protein